MYYIGLDVHKKTISYCVKDAAGCVYGEGRIGSTRQELDAWIRTLPQPRTIAMEATIFSGWIYDHLLPHASAIKVAHPLMLRAIAAARKKNDRIDASTIADCLRCDFLPECHMASTEIRDRRRTLRYRNLVLMRMKSRISGLLMETGVSYNKQRLHKLGYFTDLLSTNEEINESIRPLLKVSREHIMRAQRLDYALVSSLERDPLLASAATVIASQALISGAFSLTRQAMLLGYLPRVTVKHTAFDTEGQIYIPEVNWLLAIGCILLVLTFRESVKLAAAYGIAVTGTMAITSVLYYIVARYTWRWSAWRAGALLALFLSFDIPFLGANLFKFFEGGYVPMLIGATLIAGMLIWSRGRTALMDQYSRRYPTFEKAKPLIHRLLPSRVPGSAVFLAPDADHVPPVLMHHIERSRALHETVVLLTVKEETFPVVPEDSRFKVEDLGGGFYKLSISFGYMENPLLLPVLQNLAHTGQIPFKFEDATYYIGHETIIAKNGGLQRVPEAIFSYLNRNAVHEDRRYGMPMQQVVEIGTQIYL